MAKKSSRWVLFQHVGGQFQPLSKPFSTREQAEKAREKFPEKKRKGIGVAAVRG